MEMDELKESNSRGNDSKRSRKEEKNGLAVLFFLSQRCCSRGHVSSQGLCRRLPGAPLAIACKC